jgi:hypothetical protein
MRFTLSAIAIATSLALPAAVARETDGLPTVRTGNLAFDALFALALFEMKLDSVSEIRYRCRHRGRQHR